MMLAAVTCLTFFLLKAKSRSAFGNADREEETIILALSAMFFCWIRESCPFTEMLIRHTQKMLNHLVAVQVSDTTGDEERAEAGTIKQK
jgi:hypothetical protein